MGLEVAGNTEQAFLKTAFHSVDSKPTKKKKIMDDNIFESGFESFEFDDGFLSKVDAEIKKKEKRLESLESSSFSIKKTDQSKEYNKLEISLEDVNECNLSDWGRKSDDKIFKMEKDKKESNDLNNAFIAGLSPILGVTSFKNHNSSFSSTPLRQAKNDSVKSKQTKKNSEPSESIYFDEWDGPSESKKNLEEDQSSLITFSQAIKLIEEARSAEEANEQNELLNKSIDLLTGEIVGDVGDLFVESFNLPKADSEKKKVLIVEESICESSDASEPEAETRRKPGAAQKLEFGIEGMMTRSDSVCFDSDDGFEILTQDCMNNSKSEVVSSSSNTSSKTGTLDINVQEASEDSSLCNKKGKKFRIIESDSSSESPSPKFRRQPKKKWEKNEGCQFIESEAEVSDEIKVSSDEIEEEGEYERSFVDEGSYFTQNQNANMTARYLESVKGISSAGAFKIPKAKSYNPENVFSQIPEDFSTDYEMDSFCVNDVEEETRTELSDLEVAEKILEMDRKKKKKKKMQQRGRNRF